MRYGKTICNAFDIFLKLFSEIQKLYEKKKKTNLGENCAEYFFYLLKFPNN